MPRLKVPREKIPWYPRINTDLCTGDRECYEFCKNNVFEWDDTFGHPIVKNPYNCVLGCDACAKLCPVEAITFPTMEELRAAMNAALKEEEETAAR